MKSKCLIEKPADCHYKFSFIIDFTYQKHRCFGEFFDIINYPAYSDLKACNCFAVTMAKKKKKENLVKEIVKTGENLVAHWQILSQIIQN